MNLYVANGVVVVPTCGDDPDRDADVLAARSGTPGREVVGAARMLARAAAADRITQQVPVAA